MKEKFKSIFRFIFIKHRRITLILGSIVLLAYAFCLPRPLFQSPTSIVLEDKDGNLLGASIARDGQWRFPYSDRIPEKFEKSILEFEDRRFHYHLGVDPKGIARAIEQNIRNREVVSGGSTISMQVIRMARGNKKRNVWNKIVEAIMATRLEIGYTKKEILSYYASNAPFGGNVVGLDAASWRYYGKRPDLLSWGEAATLAVLPNSPALIHPGRNRDALMQKRNRLLDRLVAQGQLDSISCSLAKSEPLPDKPLPLPRLAPHLLDKVAYEHFYGKRNAITRMKTTIDPYFQSQTNNILIRHKERLAANGIHNACVMIMDVESGDILSYVGNMPFIGNEHAPSVDITKAPRSTGSILKPFLYAAMLDEGSLLPDALISDVPTQMGNYRPLNYFETYDGAVPASRALIRSLNVPSIRMLQQYGVEKFHNILGKMGMTTLNRPPSHYGLTLVVGGSEGNLFEITSMYASMARTLNHFYDYDGQYDPLDFRTANYVHGKSIPRTPKAKLSTQPYVLSAASIWQTFNTIQNVERPTSEGNWEVFDSDRQIAWKTGTSFGFRDAWAVGVTPKYAVGVWTGNADGEGRPGLIGVYASAPILFDIFDFLPHSDWFDRPEDEMVDILVCAESGHLALPHCETKDSLRLPKNGIRSKACPYHQTIQLDEAGKRVNAACYSPGRMNTQSWFVLPPLEEHYYQSKHPSYSKLPPFRDGCQGNHSKDNPMQMIYPKYAAKIYVPLDYDGKRSKTVFKATHRNDDATLYWHLGNEFVGQTETFHSLELDPPEGEHILTIVDDEGHQLQQKFEILVKKKDE